MLWVNLIMDTFAALALASLPPSQRVMNDPPRQRKANIITKEMARGIFGVGGLFVLLLFGFIQYFKNEDITSLTQFNITNYFANFFHFGSFENGLSAYELSLFFSIFVMLQFWNMFNAKAYRSRQECLCRNREESRFYNDSSSYYHWSGSDYHLWRSRCLVLPLCS